MRAKAMGVDKCAYCEWYDHEEKMCKAEPGVYCRVVNGTIGKRSSASEVERK